MAGIGKKALIVIDLQNDYFSGGKLPLWNADAVLDRVESAIRRARELSVEVILVQHVGDKDPSKSPFFNDGTSGVEIHPRIVAAAGSATIVKKAFADAFHHTTLEKTLRELDVDEIILCGMMTQNCVTHTAISKAAEKYVVTILPEATTTVNELVHNIALHGVSTRVSLAPIEAVL